MPPAPLYLRTLWHCTNDVIIIIIIIIIIMTTMITYIDESSAVSRTQVVEHGSLVQVSQVRHVLDLLKLGRVHLLDEVLFHHLLLHSASTKSPRFVASLIGCNVII